MPGRRARELCPQLIFVSGHFKGISTVGDAAMRVLGDFTPLVERISIDEAFADVAGHRASLWFAGRDRTEHSSARTDAS
jgi:DNA polymerase-4